MFRSIGLLTKGCRVAVHYYAEVPCNFCTLYKFCLKSCPGTLSFINYQPKLTVQNSCLQRCQLQNETNFAFSNGSCYHWYIFSVSSVVWNTSQQSKNYLPTNTISQFALVLWRHVETGYAERKYFTCNRKLLTNSVVLRSHQNNFFNWMSYILCCFSRRSGLSRILSLLTTAVLPIVLFKQLFHPVLFILTDALLPYYVLELVFSITKYLDLRRKKLFFSQINFY